MLDLFGSLAIHGGWVVGVYRKFILWNLLEIKKIMHTVIYHQPSRDEYYVIVIRNYSLALNQDIKEEE